jgi:pimeloyl-ACP methyl ester carboxylesterase
MKTLIILHGWQSSKEKWQKTKQILEDSEELKVIVPDIPGFKPETELKRPWNLNDYVEWLKYFIQDKEKTCPELAEGFFLLGHSFGGRMSIKFAAEYPEKVKRLILVSAAGIKNAPFYKKILGLGALTAKKLKIERIPFLKDFWEIFRKFFYYYILRKTDYLQASGFLKETIKNILNEDLTSLLDKISVPTLIIWGGKDRITPVKDAYLMERKIKNSTLEILKNVGHTPYLENPQILAQKIKEFLT